MAQNATPLGYVFRKAVRADGTTLPGAIVHVFDQETNSPIRIYRTPTGGPTRQNSINQIAADNGGYIEFWTVTGKTLVLRSYDPNNPRSIIYEEFDIQAGVYSDRWDALDGGGGGGGGGPVAWDDLLNKPTTIDGFGITDAVSFTYLAGQMALKLNANLYNTKGNLVTGDDTGTPYVVGVGTNNQALLADSTTASGLRWTTLTKSLVGLGNVNNTSDATKPVSGPQQAALDLKLNLSMYANKGDILVGLSAATPNALAVGVDGTFLMADSAQGPGMRWTALTKTMVGLSNVDNTSDVNKPVSTAQQTALNLKVNLASLTAKGTLIAGTAPNTAGSLAIGTDGQVLAADSSQSTGLRWIKAWDAPYWVNPVTDFGAVFNGSTNHNAAVQAALDVTFNQPPPAGFVFGKGKPLVSPSGVALVDSLTMSSWQSIDAVGAQGNSVWQYDHTNHQTPGEVTAMLTVRLDWGQQSSIGAQPSFRRMAFDGKKTQANANVTVHGLYMPEIDSDANMKDDAPVMESVLFANFQGDGIHIGKRHNQIRGFNIKSIANKGWSFWAEKSSDSKIMQVGFGRSLQGQVYLVNCASFQITQYDIWTPGNGTFEGQYVAYFLSCRNMRFFQGEIQGMIWLEGGDTDPADQTRFQVTGNMFVGFNIKVSPETWLGLQYPGHTPPGTKAYDAMVQIRGSSGVKFGFGQFGYSQGPADETKFELSATPKYVFKFTVPSDRSAFYEQEAGYVTITDVDFIHMRYEPVSGKPQVAFKNNISNDPKRVIYVGKEPGDVFLRPANAIPLNCALANGAMVAKADYPLLFIRRDFSKDLTASGPDPFPLADCTAMPVPPGYVWVQVLWT